MTIWWRRMCPAYVCSVAACLIVTLAVSEARAVTVIEYHEFGAKARAAIQLNQDYAAKIDAALKLPCIDKKAFADLSHDVIQAANAARELARVTDTQVDTRATEEEGIQADYTRIDSYRNNMSNTAQANTDRLDVLETHICKDHTVSDHPPESNLVPGQTAPGPGHDAAAPEDATKICQHCEWIRIQISDIDKKVDGWERQSATLNRISDLSDRNIQNALKDIANKIAALKAKKADLQVQLAECAKRCADAQKKAALKPATPSVATKTGGAPGTNNNAGSGETSTADSAVAPPSVKKTIFPIPFVPCPPDAPKETPASKPSDKNIERPVLPPDMTLPPAPKDPKDKQDWDELLLDMQLTEFIGDIEDVWSTAESIDDAIETANNDLAFDPQDEDAQERLEWLEVQRTYYDRWKAYINSKWPTIRVEPRTIRRCYLDPEWLRQLRDQLRPVPEHSSDDHYNPLGNFKFGVDLGGGYGDRKDDGDHKYKPLPDEGDRAAKPPTDDKPHD